MMALPATMVARLSKKREIRQEMSPVVGFRFFMNAPPQEALKLAGFCQSLTYAGITAITCLADGRRPGYRADLADERAVLVSVTVILTLDTV